MYSKLTTAAALLGAIGVASADSCAAGAYSCQNGNVARCVYTSGVYTDGGYATGWVDLETCSDGCGMVGSLAQCGASGSAATTLVTSAAAATTADSVSTGGVFAQTSAKTTAKTSAAKTSTAASSSSTGNAGTSSANVLLSSQSGQTVDATFYYDMNGGGTCGPANGISSFAEDSGYTYCEPSEASMAKTLQQRGTNNIVAMPANLITGNASKYCGKKVVVTWQGKVRDDLDLFIWDACAACSSNDGLDFSSTIFGDLAGTANCAAGRIQNEMSWQILDETVLAWQA